MMLGGQENAMEDKKRRRGGRVKILSRDRNRLAMELAGQHFLAGTGAGRLQIKRFGARSAVIRVSIFLWAIFHVITHHFTAIKI